MTVIDSILISVDGDAQFLKPNPRVHEQRVTIHHWQLRDLVLAPTEGLINELIVPSGQDIYRYNYKTRERQYLIQDMGFPPTCMTTGFGFWAAGGQRGDLSLRDLNSDYQVTITSSPSCTINNGLCFAKIGQDIKLLVSNNDATIRIFSVPLLQLQETIDFKTAVNHSSVSPDGNMMVSVGDDSTIYLFKLNSNGHYEMISTMAVTRDANFSVSWNHSSDKFAVASQDGTVHVWDIRSQKPLCKFGGEHSTITKGAARCVKFTQAGAVDLLAYSEHVSHVSIIDARTFDLQQTLRVGPAAHDTPITGLAFSPSSQSMFVGLENVILEYDIDTSTRRRFPKGALL
ncbi:WD40 repeat-like protein [Hesseltinella vesiculosa]|uniref:WD40 repeat-like protein n=1 Tax=Hesseltinella vesiculosa TaxID=101127 RepID=A0A1X2G798_9FUNG|nr:WD40 repeat-like protein [Hesseltinella vesiculosa]